MDSEQIIDVDSETDRISLELLDELASNERRTIDIRTLPARFSWLKEFAKSPAHARHAALIGRDDTLSTRLGSGTHAMTFGTPAAVSCPHKRRTKAHTAFVKEAQEQHGADVLVLTPGEYAKAKAMSESLKANAVAQRVLFSEGVILETDIEWSINGRACKSRPDARNFRTLAELKTAKDAGLQWFHRDAIRSGYHAQLAFYRRAIKHATGVVPRDVYIFAVENSRPYVVTPFRLTERALEAGDRLAMKWFEQLRVCETTNVWPPYTVGIEEFDVIDDEAEVALAMRDDDGERADPAF